MDSILKSNSLVVGTPVLIDEATSLYYRTIREEDFEQIKALHEEFFPVRYSDKFYRDVCKGTGLHNMKIFSCIAVAKESESIVGFILAQMFDYPRRSEDQNMFAIVNSPKLVCYILTLGLKSNWRRCGLGSKLVSNCIEYARKYEDCGAVYLHVIHYNNGAISFYERNNFVMLRTLADFYCIDNVYHESHLYIYYINGFSAPFVSRFSMSASSIAQVGIRYVSYLFSSLVRPTEGNSYPPFDAKSKSKVTPASDSSNTSSSTDRNSESINDNVAVSNGHSNSYFSIWTLWSYLVGSSKSNRAKKCNVSNNSLDTSTPNVIL